MARGIDMNDQTQEIANNFLKDMKEGVDHRAAESAAVVAVKALAGDDEVAYQKMITQVAQKVENALLSEVKAEADEAKREAVGSTESEEDIQEV